MHSSKRTWPIAELARMAGTTSRTLRHYESLGLLQSVRVGDGQYRHYDEANVLRLLRILLLRDMGMPLDAIGQALDAQQADLPAALGRHLEELTQERARTERKLAAVRWTLDQLKKGAPLMAENMLDGFDQNRYRQEVEERWGADTWARWQDWWKSLSPTDAQRIRAEWAAIGHGYARAKEAGEGPQGAAAQEAAKRHLALLASIPAAQNRNGVPAPGYLRGLADLYANDARYVAFTGSSDPDIGAYMRDALLPLIQDR
ncbi:MerR family transcriptional regulator [Ramlibacter sp.]|uniref:MerR family transcriptional regulator n=1 Tax=Ramlibacter sp. TaxID=1917967 RepID=UPI0017DA164B|nr:MerR family transcriptional regulator [Ramlibacter sp.]MBA2675955.1 MerR family transcriptional regulator [Ramlibacter sp.]